MPEKTLKVGVGRDVITPPIGTILFGYAPGRPAEAVGDDLYATVAAFEYGDTRSIVIAFDVCTCPPIICGVIRSAVEKETGVPYKNIIVNTSHTHSGPNTTEKRTGWGEGNHDFMYNTMLPKAVSAARTAVDSLRPALFGVGVTDSYVAANRREVAPGGEIVLGQCPWGLMDKEMTVMSFKDAESGEMILNMIHYSAHATASGANPEITRDWPGAMKDVVEREVGGVALFLAGSNGETGPCCPNGETTQSYEVAIELGKKAGHDAVRAWRSIKEWRNAPMSVTNGDVRVPYDPLPPKETALAELKRLGSEEKLISEERFREINELVRWEDIIKEYESGDIKSHYVFPQSILAIGNTAIVPFQFEMFIEMTLRLRRYSKFSHTLCLSNSNGSLAYLPSQDQICRGGYEIWQFRYANTYKMVDDADNYMVSENLKILDEAFDNLK